MPVSDAELLRLVSEWRPAATLHPIAMQAWHIYQAGGKHMPDESLQKLRTILDSYNGELKPLGEALEGLVRFSILLSDDENDQKGAARVVGLMREYKPVFEPLLERVSQALANAGIAPPARG